MSRYAKPYEPGTRFGHRVVVRYLREIPRTSPSASHRLYLMRTDCGAEEEMPGHIVLISRDRPTCTACKHTARGKELRAAAAAEPVEPAGLNPWRFVRCLHPCCGSLVRIGDEAQHHAEVHARSEYPPRFSGVVEDKDDNGMEAA